MVDLPAYKVSRRGGGDDHQNEQGREGREKRQIDGEAQKVGENIRPGEPDAFRWTLVVVAGTGGALLAL